MATPLLEIRDLRVFSHLRRRRPGRRRRVRHLYEGETLGIVGETGSGKSVTMMTVMWLITDPNARFEGEVLYKGTNLMDLPAGPDPVDPRRGHYIRLRMAEQASGVHQLFSQLALHCFDQSSYKHPRRQSKFIKIEYRRINHVTLAMPGGEHEKVRVFYGSVLGLKEVKLPDALNKVYDLIWV